MTALIVNGQIYQGWTAVRVSRGIDTACQRIAEAQRQSDLLTPVPADPELARQAEFWQGAPE